MRHIFLIAVFLLIVGCGRQIDLENSVELPGPVREGDTFTVVIEDFQFKPNTLNVKVGDKVEWVNKDGVEHTVTFEDVRLDERLPDKGTVSHVFVESGEARYFCALHPEMRGTVFVD